MNEREQPTPVVNRIIDVVKGIVKFGPRKILENYDRGTGIIWDLWKSDYIYSDLKEQITVALSTFTEKIEIEVSRKGGSTTRVFIFVHKVQKGQESRKTYGRTFGRRT